MDKKILGLRLGTLISFFACLLVAFLIWLYANYTAMSAEELVSIAPRFALKRL